MMSKKNDTLECKFKENELSHGSALWSNKLTLMEYVNNRQQ